MKISAYHKSLGDHVELCTSYDNLDQYDQIYCSKVFTDTQVPECVLQNPRVQIGGTGFFYDKAPPLPDTIEHMKPDYHLYDAYVDEMLRLGGRRKDYTYYLDYSIGFLTRGCFRQCPFCVNQNYVRCIKHSPVAEFLDSNRPKICFLDDNFFACSEWENIISDVLSTKKRFQFKQGLDERLLDDKKIHALMSWPYDGDYIFAFDNIEDKDIIETKLKRIKQLYPNTKKHFKFYVLCGYDRNDKYDDQFWINDIRSTFERIKTLARYNALPYVMRYERVNLSPYKGMYTSLAGWCNQPRIFNKFSFREYCICKGMGSAYSTYKRDYLLYLDHGGKKGRAWRDMEDFASKHKDMACEYFDLLM